MSKSAIMSNIEMQGTVLAPLKCSVSIDQIGNDALINNHKNLYSYKKCVTIPPMSMIDDILTVTKCSNDSIKINALIEAKTAGKQLNLGEEKCSLMHIGKSIERCRHLTVNGFAMNTTQRQTYLGDIISSDGKIDQSVSERHNRGIGVVTQILALLSEVYFGHHYFEMAFLFRNTMLINSILCSIEAVHGIKTHHIEKLEACDKFLLRKLLNARFNTAIEALYLETGLIPIRFIIVARRLVYYWNILQKPETELVKQVFNAQKIAPLKNDWILQIEDDLKLCNINYTEQEITNMSKAKFKAIVKESIRETARNYLIDLKNSHSKSKGLDNSYQLQPYLQCDSLSLQEKQLLFKFRTFTYEVKNNYKYKYKSDLTCHNCTETDSQEHLLNCSIADNISKDNCKPDDIFNNLEKQIKIVRILVQIDQKRQLSEKYSSSSGSQEHSIPHSAGGDVPHVYVFLYT